MAQEAQNLVQPNFDGQNYPSSCQSISIPANTLSLKTIKSHQTIDILNRCELVQGSASAPCGITIISAYANLIGSCLAIKERIEVSAQLVDACSRATISFPMQSADKYLSACLKHAFKIAGRPLPAYLNLHISGRVPAGNGIKTSSAFGVSLTSTVFSALGYRASASVVVNTSSDAAREGGVTQAGSIDDNWASVRGGVVVTDGSSRELLASCPAPENVEVLILIPACPRPRVHFLDRRKIMAPHKRSFDLFASRLLKSHDMIAGMYTAMSDAAFVTARAFDYPTLPLDLALRCGALGVSLSGKGPAIGAITEASNTENIIAAWRQFPGRIIRTRPDNIGLHTSECMTTASALKTRKAIGVV